MEKEKADLSVNGAKGVEGIIHPLPLLHLLQGILQLFHRTVLIQLDTQPLHHPAPMQQHKIWVSQLVTQIMPIVPVLVQPPLVACQELWQSFGEEFRVGIGDGFLDGDLAREAVVVDLKVDVEGDGFLDGVFFGC